jgi:putative transposase
MRVARGMIEDGAFYHLYNRGNRKEAIFHSAHDYERFLWMFCDAAAEYGVGVHAYCLMPNHYHALVRQQNGGSMVAMMRSFGTSFSMYFNRTYGFVGHVFQGRYRTRRIVTDADLLWVSRYIHRNPVGLAAIGEYEWSSYRAYVGEMSRFCDPNPVLSVHRNLYTANYATFCEDVKGTVPTGPLDNRSRGFGRLEGYSREFGSRLQSG